jgi:hypothetical protein
MSISQAKVQISQFWSDYKIKRLKKKTKIQNVCLEITAKDPQAKCYNLNFSEIAFIYELNNWRKNTTHFNVCDPFIIKYAEKFPFLYAFFHATI